jgi:DivIVA domain-containing protein
VSYFLIFLAVAVAGAVALYVVGLNKPSAAVDGSALADSLADPVANLPPVLLPDVPHAEDVDRLRFSLGLRGYRMDQVDEVLDRLRDQLAVRDARIAELEEALGGDARTGIRSGEMQARPE